MRLTALLAIMGACAMSAGAEEPVSFRVHGQAWTEAGRMMSASDAGADDPGGNPINVSGTNLQSLGAQLGMDADLGENWTGRFGLGVYQASTSLGTVAGNPGEASFYNVSMFKPYVAQANLTYHRGPREAPWLSVTAGNFAFNYHPDVHNLGLYLFRGPVYPGVLMGGFQAFETDSSKATLTGFRVGNALGNFRHDLLLLQERSLPPMLDWTLGYVARYRAFGALEVGAGVNFYRLVPYRATLETPGKLPNGDGEVAKDGTLNYTVSGSDTTFYTHQGTKLMAMFSLDLKRWLPLRRGSAEDFRLYGEAAVLGVKDQGSYYDDIKQRIPVMLGFNVPTWGILDRLSLEAEWYGSPYRNDLYNVGNPAAIVAPWMNNNGDFLTPLSSPVPVYPGAYADSTRDNWKWSVLLEKRAAKHVRLIAQVANDHTISPPIPTGGVVNSKGGTASLLTAPMSMRMAGIALGALAAAFAAHADDEVKLEYHGAGWTQFGRIEKSYTRTSNETNDYNKNWLQNAGGQLGVVAKLDDEWEGGFSMGVVEVHLPRGNRSGANLWYPFWVAYVGEARVTYSRSLNETAKLQVTAGNFGYGYNPDVKNLGAYLMRGYVYPGTLESGSGNVFGALARYEQGPFRNDILLKSEDQKPVYDGSLIDVATWRVRQGLEVGAGVNFYRLFKQNRDLTSPGETCYLPYGQCAIIDYSDTAGGQPPDTLTGSLSGTKLMARFSLDPKALFGLSGVGGRPFGKSDLTLYGEAALLGTKSYPVYFEDAWRRMPVMMGFNLPMLGYLDFLSVEAEYYASRNSSDQVGAAFGSAWVTSNDPDAPYYVDRDDWKWSVNAAKTLFGSLQLSGQVANDHLRLGGTHDIPWVGKEALRTPGDWYWTLKLAYFF
jgi:hypothetical protein